MRVLAVLIAVVLLLVPPMAPAAGQSTETGSFLDPFPENDKYRVQVWGDAMADGLTEGLVEALAVDPRLQLEKKHRWLGGLLKVEMEQEIKTIEAGLANNPPHIAVVMLGAGDRVSIRRPNGRRAGVGSDEWKAEYAQRLDLLMRAFRKKSIGVFWVGLPIMRRQDVSDDAEMMNELFRNRALANGVRFVDIFASFADADKSFSAHGPDLAGKIRLLRDGDGVLFTGAGYLKLAYFVERELKRAAQQAWDERTIPLAGTEPEQQRIRPQSNVKLAPLAPSAAKAADGSPLNAGPARAVVKAPADGAADASAVKADHSRITLKTTGAQGREESVTLEILRPAIPAAVVSLITRRESEDKPSQVGDAVMTEILGGLTVVSSVTPLADTAGDRKRAQSKSSPMFAVLQRRETLPPKPGRADEMPWPRPEAVAESRTDTPPAATVPAAATQPAPPPRRPTGRQDGKRG